MHIQKWVSYEPSYAVGNQFSNRIYEEEAVEGYMFFPGESPDAQFCTRNGVKGSKPS